MFSVERKSQTKEIGLPRVVRKAIVRKIRKLIGFKIQDGKRLFSIVRVRAKSAVQKHGEASVGRYCRCRGEIVDLARFAWNFTEQAPIRKLRSRLLAPRERGNLQSNQCDPQ